MEIGEERATFGSRLKERRTVRGWTQEELASRTGGLCTKSNISRLETSKQTPEIETVDALASALGWSVSEARKLAGYNEGEPELSRADAEERFRFAVHGYKKLSLRGQRIFEEHTDKFIAYMLDFEQGFVDDDPPKSETPGLKLADKSQIKKTPVKKIRKMVQDEARKKRQKD